MNSRFKDELAQLFSTKGLGVIVDVKAVSGGSINDVYRIETDAGILFLKANSALRYPNMFKAEVLGLELLSTSGLVIPTPVSVGQFGDLQYLLMEWVEQGRSGKDLWNQFGRGLAELHQNTNKQFGLDHDNYIGCLPQSNTVRSSWAEFYREERLVPQMKLAERSGQLSAKMRSGFDGLFNRLEEIYPIERPSMLHGDLWSGNMMVNTVGKPCIFDPAVYYGHREMDLAMMALFGGFADGWINSYAEIHPLENGWQQRMAVGQLYPLMVHLNLFGDTYTEGIESVLRKFS